MSTEKERRRRRGRILQSVDAHDLDNRRPFRLFPAFFFFAPP
jgi:hypothetical protein